MASYCTRYSSLQDPLPLLGCEQGLVRTFICTDKTDSALLPLEEHVKQEVWPSDSFFRPEVLALLLQPGVDPLIEKEIGAGGKDLLQIGFAHNIIRDPQPLAAGA